MYRPPNDTIHRLTLRYKGTAHDSHTPALLIRLEHVLRMVDWCPSGMKPGAILLVRQLRGLPSLDGAVAYPFGWERVLQERLMFLYQHAVRSHNGFIAPDAESILFEDAAELVIQLTYDLAMAVPAAPRVWYWRQIQATLSSYRTASPLLALWTHYAAALPAVFSALLPSRIIEYASLLPPVDTPELLEALCRVFELKSVYQAASGAASRFESSGKQSVEHALSTSASAMTSGTPLVIPPWTDHIHPMLLDLSPVVQALIGWSVMLRRAPAFARSLECASQIETWISSTMLNKRGSIETRTQQRHEKTSYSHDHTGISEPPRLLTDASQPVQPDTLEVSVPALPLREGEWTELGGVLFLYHLLQWLQIPALWDSRISLWAGIEAVACALLGGQRFPDDPMWSALAVFDGREAGARIGEEFESPLEFKLPEMWRMQYGAFLADVGLEDHWPADVDHWIAPFAAIWLRGALPFIRALLVAAVDDDTLTSDEIASLVLCKGGRLGVSKIHIDLYFSQNDADNRIRRAGLDLNPGWVPALGYIVTFHFTD